MIKTETSPSLLGEVGGVLEILRDEKMKPYKSWKNLEGSTSIEYCERNEKRRKEDGYLVSVKIDRMKGIYTD